MCTTVKISIIWTTAGGHALIVPVLYNKPSSDLFPASFVPFFSIFRLPKWPMDRSSRSIGLHIKPSKINLPILGFIPICEGNDHLITLASFSLCPLALQIDPEIFFRSFERRLRIRANVDKLVPLQTPFLVLLFDLLVLLFSVKALSHNTLLNSFPTFSLRFSCVLFRYSKSFLVFFCSYGSVIFIGPVNCII